MTIFKRGSIYHCAFQIAGDFLRALVAAVPYSGRVFALFGDSNQAGQAHHRSIKNLQPHRSSKPLPAH